MSSKYSLNKTDQDGKVTGTMELEVRVYPIAEPKNNTKAFAAVNIDGMFAISGISVIEGQNGLFASMPQAKDNKGAYRDIAFPVTREGRQVLNEAVIAEYAASLGNLEAKQESTLANIKERKEAASRSGPDKTATDAVKDTTRDAKKKAGPDL